MVRCAVFVVAAVAAIWPCAVAQQPTKDAPLTAGEAKKLKNPIEYSKQSVAQGRATFVRYCAGCHGNDGKAQVDVVADATDLTAPKTWKNGTSEGEIFRSIRDGQSASMPAFKSQIRHEEDLWHLVNFIQSLWPDGMKPKQKAGGSSEPSGSATK
jgi:mono/diheme cytochrome c family protein